MNIGKSIKVALAKKEITAIQLANKSGIPYSSIRNYINNRTAPCSDRIYEIAKALDVKSSELIALGEE